ncbi:MAG: helix-turn-helix domain-containing protein [Rhizobiaceae bacterium]|nr:helix-turn-helix domain-containing protein [Rhizobiaceae bacterium]
MTIHARSLGHADRFRAHQALSHAILPAAEAQPVAFYPAGSEIYAQGEAARKLYQVAFGCVRIYRMLADGRRQIAAFHLAGDVFGFEADGTHHFFAEAVDATGIHAWRHAANAPESQDVLQLALLGLVRAQEHMLVLGRQNAAERVAAFLVDMAERQGDTRSVDLPMSRTDIADYLGLTIETVSRVFSRLKQDGIIRLPSLRSVEMVKWSALRDMTS